MTAEHATIAIAIPKHEDERARLRARMAIHGIKLPALYPDGVERPCTTCGLVLDVGPRIRAGMEAGRIRGVICPDCFASLLRITDIGSHIVSLGNPDSKYES